MTPALRFLATLWPEGPPEGQDLLLWTLPDKRSRWGHDLDALARQALDLAPTHDVYVGIGAGMKPARPEIERLKAGEVLTVPGHAADLDFGELGHEKRNLFRDEGEALDFLGSVALAPTVVVNSGGGLQAWWLYHERWELDDDERDEAVAISRGWTNYLRDEAKARGRVIDSVFDLSRVLRIPGTVNHKNGLVRAVALLSHDGPRYDPSNFEVWRAGSEIRTEWLDLQPSPGLDAAPLEALAIWPKLQVLCELDPKFKATWQRRRPELPSPSEYDLALATKLWAAGWEAQEILDALIHWRRIHSLDPCRPDKYLRYTIPKAVACEWATAERESLKIHEAVLEASQEGKAPDLDAEKILAQIRRELGVQVSRLERDGEEYSLVLESGITLRLGTRDTLQQQAKWRAIAWEQQVSLRRLKPAAWDRVLDLLALIVEDHTTEEITPAGELLGWIASHRGELRDLTDAPAAELAEIYKAPHHWGFSAGGDVVVFSPSLRERLASPPTTLRLTAAQLQTRLRALGAEKYFKSTRD